MKYKTTKRIIVTIYLLGLCFLLSVPLLNQKRTPSVYIPSWERTETQRGTRDYDIVNDSFGYKSIAPIVILGSIFYLFAAAVYLAEKASDETLHE